MSQIEVSRYFCGKHRFQTNDALAYHLHIIDEHDSEHGFWQPAGEPTNWKKRSPTGEMVPWYGVFRYLPMFCPMGCNCRCNTGSGCWQGNKCYDPYMHRCTTPEEYQSYIKHKWGNGLNG